MGENATEKIHEISQNYEIKCHQYYINSSKQIKNEKKAASTGCSKKLHYFQQFNLARKKCLYISGTDCFFKMNQISVG